MSATNPFGLVPGEGTPFRWLDEADRSVSEAWAALRPLVLSDLGRAKAAVWAGGWPDVIHPGDIAPLRCAGSAVASDNGLAFADLIVAGKVTEYLPRRLVEVDVRRLERTYGSELVFLDASTAVSLLGAFRPDSDLFAQARLPWRRCLVMFGSPLRFDADSSHWRFGDAAEREAVDSALREGMQLAGEPGASSAIALWTRGGGLFAVGLEADEDGKLDDWVRWHLFGVDPDSGRWTEPTVEIGRLSQATLAPLVENLVCALCWGKFSQRPSETLPATERDQRKLFATSSFKRRARSGAIDGIRILDISHTEPDGPAPQRDDQRRARTVTSHLRRGHWRRVRVVTRDERGERVGRRDGVQGVDWQYAGRWIQPTLVTGTADATAAVTRVYRLPEPPSDDDWEAYRRVTFADADVGDE